MGLGGVSFLVQPDEDRIECNACPYVGAGKAHAGDDPLHCLNRLKDCSTAALPL